MGMTSRLLIVDDEAAIGFALSEYFGCSGWETDWVASLDEAKAQVRAKDYTAAIIDLCLSGGEGTEGLEVLDELHRQHPETLCILLTAYGSPWATDEARRRGAALIVDKPARLAELQRELQRWPQVHGHARRRP
jgi:DNA-binding NtrC family response regulator